MAKGQMRRTSMWLVFAVLVAGLAVSCSTEFTGEKGNIKFKYTATDYSFGERPPIAVGASLQVTGAPANSNGSSDTGSSGDTGTSDAGASLTFSSVRSSKPSVVAVENTSDDRFTLAGKKAGTATIEVQATSGGEQLEDAFDIDAADVQEVKLSHRCASSSEGGLEAENVAYFTGQKANFRYRMSESNGEPLAGYGKYPFTVGGSTDASIDSDYERVGLLQVETGATAGTAQLEPDVQGSEIDVQLVAPKKAEQFIWPQRDGTRGNVQFGELAVDSKHYLHPRFQVGGKTVCQAAPSLEIQNQTEEVCEVSVTDTFDDQSGDAYRLLYGSYQGIAVRGLSAGACSFEVVLPAAETDVAATVQMEIVDE